MDFQPDSGLEIFREEVQNFLRENLTPDLVQKSRAMMSERSVVMRWQKILYNKGWGAPGWAKEHGGSGWSVVQRMVFEEECVKAGAPTQDIFGQSLLGPAVNHFGTPEQIAEHIGPTLRGERLWCQGFSEPNSGSDLASLRTRAELDGDEYVVNGQKIWTSYAHHADWIFLLVRSNPEAKKQAGISFLLVDMKTPGITIRPIISIDGQHHLNEVFFDNVRVPQANRVGADGDGWEITKFLLNNEHASTADLPALKGYIQQIRSLGQTLQRGDKKLIEHRDFALRLARFEAEVSAVAMMVARVAAMEQEEDHSPFAHAIGSMLKLRGTDLQQRLNDFLVETLGDHGAVSYVKLKDVQNTIETSMQDFSKGIASEMFFRRAATIYGGSNEVQRGIISKLMFQL